MTDNYECQTCGVCMAKSFVGEHRWLTGHKTIIKKPVEEVAKEINKRFGKKPSISELGEQIGIALVEDSKKNKPDINEIHCTCCGYNFGEINMLFSKEVKLHSEENHNGLDYGIEVNVT